MPSRPPHAAQPALRYVPALDGLRAVAVLAVFAGHLSYGRIPGGFVGVEVFFVLSGFLITSLLLGDWRRTGRVAFGEFWLRRGARLLPALTLTVAGVFVLYALDSQVAVPGESLWTIPTVMLYAGNWVEADSGGSLGYLQHTWSLAIEGQFYLVWPVALVLMLRVFRPPRILTVVLIAAIASAIGRYVVALDAPYQSYNRSDTRACALLFGCALALALADPAIRSRARRWASMPVAVVALATVAGATLALGYYERATYGGGLLVVSLAAAALIAHVSFSASAVTRLLCFAPVLWVGRRSYGIYLYHFPVVHYLTDLRLHSGHVVEILVRIGVTFALAALSYRYIEQPILRRTKGHVGPGAKRAAEPAASEPRRPPLRAPLAG